MEVVVSSMSSGVKDVVETGVSGWVRSDPKTKNQGGDTRGSEYLGSEPLPSAERHQHHQAAELRHNKSHCKIVKTIEIPHQTQPNFAKMI